MSTLPVGWPDGSVSGSGPITASLPPWLSFSGRCPWVTWPGTSTLVANGSSPVEPSAIQAFMMPIDSYQDALLVSWVVWVDSTSPALMAPRQSSGDRVMATSQDTAPAGSKYL